MLLRVNEQRNILHEIRKHVTVFTSMMKVMYIP